jgi:hypothetical protein
VSVVGSTGHMARGVAATPSALGASGAERALQLRNTWYDAAAMVAALQDAHRK